ncbi:chaperone SurA [Rubritalea halochordaticola]|uniref:Chaperone SurA n=1 Tax=Rubritalea halochordaticola TaxID=714537 RepID=A0ABP9UWK3_9BACT
MKMSSKFVIRLGLWSVLMLYLLFDLVLFNGPLKRSVRKMQGFPEEKLASDMERQVVARVFDKPILLSQVDYGVDKILWRTGRTRNDVSKSERIALRNSVLQELIDQYIFRIKVKLNADEYPVSDEEIEAALRRFASRFTTKDELFKAMDDMGFEGEKELRFRLAAKLQQDKYLEAHIAPGIVVSEEEAKQWYEDHKKELTTPASLRARHIFLAALTNKEEEATQKLEDALKKITSQEETFENLAASLSEDERNKNSGGDLGWMTQSRLPLDFSTPVFALPKGKAQIIRTKLGWHLIEVTDKKEPQLRSYEELKPEIFASLETTRRKAAIKDYRERLRYREKEHVIIHQDMLEDDWTH